MCKFSGYFFATFVGTLFLSSCSRPVSYVQPSVREQFTRTKAPTSPRITAYDTIPTTVQPIQTLDQADALVRNDNKLTANKPAQKRLSRIQTLLATTSKKVGMGSTETTAYRKMNLMERLMLKKVNKTIRRQLAPANPNHPMANRNILIIGVALAVGGILLFALTNGVGAFIGTIALAVGLILVLVDLF